MNEILASLTHSAADVRNTRPMRSLIVFLLLAACSSPGVRYLGVDPVTVEVEGWRIDVYSDGERAQAIRMTAEFGARTADMDARGRMAVEKATGCRLDGRTVKHDANVLDARLICDTPSTG